MPNAFLIIRSVFFALTAYLALLSLIFSSWNISASISSRRSVPAPPIVMILESLTLFVCIALGLAGYLRKETKVSRVAFECTWSAVLSLFQIGVAIGISVSNRMLICHDSRNWGVCASAALLVPVAWLNSFVVLAYFFTLFISSVAHARTDRCIWLQATHTVPWFTSQNKKSWSIRPGDIESSSARKQLYAINGTPITAPWAREQNIRRGVDCPFVKRDGLASGRTTPLTFNTPLPTVPLRLPTKPELAFRQQESRYIENLRDSETPSQLSNDHDLPIPLPRLSEWVRADAFKGISVHTIPLSP